MRGIIPSIDPTVIELLTLKMILSDRQYGITKTKVKEFEQAIAKLNERPKPTNINEQIRHQAHLETLHSQLKEFQEEITGYSSRQS